MEKDLIAASVNEAVSSTIHQLIAVLKSIEKSKDRRRLVYVLEGLLERVRFDDDGYLIDKTVSSDLEDDNLFYMIVRIAVDTEDIDQNLIVEKCPGTPGSIQNWINETHAPQLHYRIRLFRFFLEELKMRSPEPVST